MQNCLQNVGGLQFFLLLCIISNDQVFVIIGLATCKKYLFITYTKRLIKNKIIINKIIFSFSFYVECIMFTIMNYYIK